MEQQRPGTSELHSSPGRRRGSGLAMAEALADRGWALVIDARRADRLEAAAASLADARASVTALAGDITDAHHRAQLVAAVEQLGRLDLLVNNASTLGASPLPPLDTIDLDVLRRVLRGERRSLRSRLIQPLLGHAHEVGRHDREHHVRRRGRGLRAVGRLRLVEGRARTPARRFSRPSTPSCRVLGRRSRRHAHRDAPRRVPGRGHLRPTPAGDRRPASRRADRERPTEWSVSAGGGAGMTARARLHRCRRPLDPDLEASAPAEVRGRGRDDVRLLVSEGDDGVDARRRSADLPHLPACRRRARREHLGDRPGRDLGDAARTAHGPRPLLDRAARRTVARRGPAARRRHHEPDDRRPHRRPSRLDGGGRLSLLERFAGSQRLWLASPHLPGDRARASRGAR